MTLIKIAGKMLLTILPLLYMYLIWWQSSNFNPESIYILSTKISMKVLIGLGVVLELTHLLEFGILYLLLIIAFLTYGPIGRGHVWAAFLVSILYAIADEVHQAFVPFRSFSVADLIKDLIGIAVVMILVRRNYFRKKRTALKKVTAFFRM